MRNRYKPIGNTKKTLDNRYVEPMARLQKIKDAGYTVVSIWVSEFRKYCVTLLALKMNFAGTPL